MKQRRLNEIIENASLRSSIIFSNKNIYLDAKWKKKSKDLRKFDYPSISRKIRFPEKDTKYFFYHFE